MGPLNGYRIIEFAGLGPGPYGAMLLADLGADVVRIDRAGNVVGGDPAAPPGDVLARGRRSVGVDLKNPDGVEAVLDLGASADALVEGFRPGVMERLGLGPDVCMERNPKLVYARMTGWGQDGPYAPTAGHDINYIALAGALEPMGRAGQQPTPPINLIGDFGGGGMMLAMGVCATLLETSRSGQGQVIDAAMVDGAASLMAMTWSFRAMGLWNDERGTNMLDTGAHFYDIYECADGRYVSVGCIEPQFYARFLEGVGLAGADLPDQWDKERWPVLRERFAAVLRTRTRDEWAEVFADTDACVTPVLSMAEAADHPHVRARGSVVRDGDVVYPGPAPRFSRTPGRNTRVPGTPAPDLAETLKEWGVQP